MPPHPSPPSPAYSRHGGYTAFTVGPSLTTPQPCGAPSLPGKAWTRRWSTFVRRGLYLDCIATVRAFRHCELSEAKRLVESLAAWTDVRERTEESFRVMGKDESQNS